MNILRFESYHDFPTAERGDGYIVSQYCDIYQAGWYYQAADGIHAAGGKIIAYLNFASMPEMTGTPPSPNPNYNPDWTLKDINGNIVYVSAVPNNKAMDPLNQGFRDYVTNWVQNRLNEGYDGVFADNGVAPRFPDDFTYNTVAENPRTPGIEYTDDDYARDRVDLLNYVKSVFPTATVVSNGFWTGRRFYDYYASYLNILQTLNIDAVFSEGVFTDANGVIRNETEWIQSVSMIEEIQSLWLPRGKQYVSYSQGGLGASYNGISEDQMAAFLYASSLMGFTRENGNVFCAHNAMRNTIQDILALDLGSSVGVYTQLAGTQVFQRVFSKYKVFVNISTSITYDIQDYGTIAPLGSLFIAEETTPSLQSILIPIALIVGLSSLKER